MILRLPELSDSPDLYALTSRCQPLDLNSRYAYMLVATHFSQTSIVAESEGKIVGYVSGYKLPDRPDTLFVWQVAVAEETRGKKLAQRLLLELLKQPVLHDVTWLQTTVTPSNTASRKLFHRLSKELDSQLVTEPWITKDLFAEDMHEDEHLFHIGPFQIQEL